jgi:hypothetical protein
MSLITPGGRVLLLVPAWLTINAGCTGSPQAAAPPPGVILLVRQHAEQAK